MTSYNKYIFLVHATYALWISGGFLLITIIEGPKLMELPSLHTILWSLRNEESNMVNYTQAPNALLTLHWPNQVTLPCLISLSAEKFNPTSPQKERRTGTSVHGFSDCTCIDSVIEFVPQPCWLWSSSLAFSFFFNPSYFQRENISGRRTQTTASCQKKEQIVIHGRSVSSY